MVEDGDLDWRYFLFRELPHVIFDVDHTFARTLVSLIRRPGELAEAFVAGRRRPFITPVRLYILAFLVYAVTGSFVGHHHASLNLPARASLIDPTGLLNNLLDMRGAEFWKNPATEEMLTERAKWLSECGTFIVAIFIALLQSIVFVGLRRRYLEHLTLALSVLTFYLMCISVGQLLLLDFPLKTVWKRRAPYKL